jgi:hypothetical protein
MSQRSQEQQDQVPDPQLVQGQEVESQTPVNQQGAAADALQRAKGASSFERISPSDVLHLQRTIGNQKTQRVLGQNPVSVAAPGSVQRHVPPEADAQGNQSRAQMIVSKEQTKGSLGSATEGAQAMLGSFNTLIRAFWAAKSYPAQGPEDQSQGGEDIYED